jgi:hypothetical protein
VVRKATTGTTTDSQWLTSTSSGDPAWSRGLGFEVSPLKMHSARRKAGHSSNPMPMASTSSDLGVLRGLKSLARDKI